LLRSFVVSTQPAAGRHDPASGQQVVLPDGQVATHCPRLQTLDGGHTLPHTPQLLGSLDVATHRLLAQGVVNAGQTQALWVPPSAATPRHSYPSGQALPHPPQFNGSVVGRTHTVLPQTI
jgi:hypothetical protein